MQNALSKLIELLQQKMNDSFRKNVGTILCSSLLEMYVQSLKLIA